MKNTEIAELLYEIADFLELQDVEFKPRAYRRAARNVESTSEPIEEVHERGELEDIDGVGESIATKIAEYLETGELEYYEELRADLPIDIEAITSVEGVGPKTAEKLYRALGVATLEDLERAAAEGEIADVEGFGEKTQANILRHVAAAREGRERMLLGRAFPIADQLRSRLAATGAFDRLDVVGSFRRRKETVGDVDVLATAPDAGAAMDAFCEAPDVEEVLARGDTRSSIVVAGGLQVDVRVVDPEQYGAALVYFTGSKDHNVTLRNRAIDRGWKLNEYGLFDVDGEEDGAGTGGGSDSGEGTDAGDATDDPAADFDPETAGELLAGETEAEVYGALDLEYVPPELREDTGEVAAAAAGELPDLVETDDVRGDLQCHTTDSDGSASVREMAAAADDLGREYLLISDHGPGLRVPRGITTEEFEEQRAAVDAANDDPDLGVRVLHGVEANVVADGLDVPPAVYEACDVLVAALHDRPANPTERLVRAMEEYPVDVLAHPLNRLINEREPLDLDLEAVAATAAEQSVALEINAQPQRMDLDWRNVERFRDGVQYVVSTDAHSTADLELLHLGVSVARRGWCEAADVLNTRPVEDLLSYLHG